MSRRRFLVITPDSSSVRILFVVVVVAVAWLGASGCVQRRMTVRSNVEGAQVYVDNYEIGRTPVSTDFIYYGKRDVRLVKDGYETLKVRQSVNAPWYQYPGIDFFFENVWPWEIRDERNFNYQMQPQYLVPTETILSRAEELRSQNAAAATAPVVAQPQVVVPGAAPMIGQPGAVQPSYGVPPGGTPAPYPGPTIMPGYTPQPSLYPPQNPAGMP